MSSYWGLHTAADEDEIGRYKPWSESHKSSTTPFIARGTTVDFPEHDHDLFQAVHQRRATPEQLLRLITHNGESNAGVWWGTYGGEHGEHDPEHTAYGNLQDFQDHTDAGANDDLAADYYVESGQYRPNDPDEPIFAQVPVVMIGQRPQRGKELWDPEIHNPPNGLMGNSYLNDEEPVPLHEIHYHTGTDWVRVKMPKGISVKASKTDGIRYAAVVDADVAEDLQRLAMPSRDAYDDMIMDRLRKTDDVPEQGEFYHGSNQEHQPGDILESVRARGDRDRLDYYERSVGAPNHADWVWMYNHPAPATKYHKNVYQLEPLDEGPWIWNNIGREDGSFRPTENDEDFPRLVSPRARVIRKLSPDEHAAASQHLNDYYERYWAEQKAHTARRMTAAHEHVPSGQRGRPDWTGCAHPECRPDLPTTMYHVSHPDNRESIARHGLLASYSQDDEESDELGMPHGIYMTADEPKTSHDTERYPGDVWAIDTTQLRHLENDFPGGMMFRNAFATKYDVPPTAMQLHRPSAHRTAGRKTAMPQPLPPNITFQYHDGSDSLATAWPPGHRLQVHPPAITAHLPGEDRSVGHIQWFPENHPWVQQGVAQPGEVSYIWVDPNHRRHGIADALFDKASEVEPNLHHSDQTTELGRDWVRHERSRHQRQAMPQPLPQGVYFRYHPELMWSPGVTAHAPGGQQIGSLEWYDDDHVMVDLGTRRPGEIDRIQVSPDHQGHSVATSMFDFAKQHEPRLHHSDQLTEDGRGWSDYEKARNARLAAVTQDLVDRLHDEFHQWAGEGNALPNPYAERGDKYEQVRGPIGYWRNIENFLADRYPAAHKGFSMGQEQAQTVLDNDGNCSLCGGTGTFPQGKRRCPDCLGTHYETGPEAVARHGYDPAEIAASMVLLHNKSHPLRGDLAEKDQQRLTDIFQKRMQMQRQYEQRTRTAGKNGPPPPMTFEPFNTPWTNGIMARHADDGRPIAHLHWYPDGEIETIRVHPQLQGRDIGKEILKHAVAHPETYPAEDGIQPSNHLTPAGRAFARSLGHNPSDAEVTPAEDESQWAWKAVKNYVPLHVPYTGQNEDEMSRYLTQPWSGQQRTAAHAGDGWPVWWRGRRRPDMPFDKRWHPNHPQHTPPPWTRRARQAMMLPAEAVAHAQEVLARRDGYAQEGMHPEGVSMIGQHPDAHHIDMTPAWAAEKAAYPGALGQRAKAYHQAAERVLATPDDVAAHQGMEDARNRMRIELQHSRAFQIPDLGHFSRITDPAQQHPSGSRINPRFRDGNGGDDLPSRNAYMINCQRCALAAEAVHHGFNVEAQQRYHAPKGGSSNDFTPTDHQLASWWRDADGMPGQWIDPQDQFAPGDDGPHHWDHMTNQIASWGPRARAILIATYPGTSGEARHVFNARVRDDGSVHYIDHQRDGQNADHYRDRIDYSTRNGRMGRRSIIVRDPLARITEHNKIESPLRFMRTDDKTLAPDAAKYLVDRGTADDTPIPALWSGDTP